MSNSPATSVDFNSLSPYVRYVMELNHIAEPDGIKVPPRIIYDHELIFMVQGSGQYKIEQQDLLVGAGDLHFIRPHQLNSCIIPARNDFHYYAVHFDLVYMGEQMDFSPDETYVTLDYKKLETIPVEHALSERPVLELRDIEFPTLIHTSEPYAYLALFRELHAVFQAKVYGYQIELRALLLQIIKRMITDLRTSEGVRHNHPHKEEMIRAIQYMYDHYELDLDVRKISQMLSLSANYFRTLFKDATGQTPLEFHTRIRIDKAKELLLAGNLSISEICNRVGYNNLHSFSRLFKKMEGLSPKHYADSLRRRA